jgi:hypothetical protein
MIESQKEQFMDIKGLPKKAGLFIGLCLIIGLSASGASAWWGGRHGGYSHGYYGGYYGGFYGHHGWGFYRPHYWGLDFTYVTPSVGAVVAYMPEGYTTLVVNGIRYYYCDGYYFRSCPSGYVIVPAPEARSSSAAEPSQTTKSPASGSQAQQQSAAAPLAQAAQSGSASAKSGNEAQNAENAAAAAPAKASAGDGAVTINIPNAGGGFTAVKLTKYKDGYKGPQGEFYPNHPTVEELKALYGGAQ